MYMAPWRCGLIFSRSPPVATLPPLSMTGLHRRYTPGPPTSTCRALVEERERGPKSVHARRLLGDARVDGHADLPGQCAQCAFGMADAEGAADDTQAARLLFVPEDDRRYFMRS